MQSDDFEDNLKTSLVTRPVMEQAKGVLVGARCATPEEAFAELRDVSQAHDVNVNELAAALVEVAAGRTPEDPMLRKIVWQEWSDALPTC